MVRITRPHLTRPAIAAALPGVAGGIVALAVAGFFVILPDWRLEGLVTASGLPRLLPLAAPPLGLTARGLLALAAGGLAGAVTWSALFLLFGPGGVLSPRPSGEAGAPTVRRADAHPDAPPRRPLSAAELGTPPAPARTATEGRDLPADLEQPLAAFDPQAIPDVPREPVRAVPPLPVATAPEPPPLAPPPPAPPPPPPPPALELPALEPVAVPEPADEPAPPLERIETFELTPMVRGPSRQVEPEPAPSIEALLERLERGTRRSGTP